MKNLTRITRDPEVMGGKPCIRGMRVTVGTIVGLVASGQTTEQILRAYPYLEAGDIQEALGYAAWRSEEIEVPLGQAMKILLDMNLSPDWCDALRAGGHEAIHWSTVGAVGASDHEIMEWAAENGYVVFTHDLDFSAILSATQAVSPSVLQIRTQAPTTEQLGKQVLAVIEQFRTQLSGGAIVVFDESKARVRVLPIRR